MVGLLDRQTYVSPPARGQAGGDEIKSALTLT
jgi:hypothetical protein